VTTHFNELGIHEGLLELRRGDMEHIVAIPRSSVQYVIRIAAKPEIHINLGSHILTVSYADRDDGGEEWVNDFDAVERWLGQRDAREEEK